MYIVMVRHGRIDPSDKKLLEIGNPHLDEGWRNRHLPGVGEQLRDIPFSAIYCGKLHRSVETLQTLIASFGLLELWITDEFLDDPSTYHDGRIYPPNVLPSFIAIIDSIPSYLYDIERRHGADARILMVSGGAEIISMIAVSEGLNFQSEAKVQSWMVKEIMNEKVGFVGTGSIHPFVFNPYSRKVKKISLEEMRDTRKRRRV